MVSQALEEMMGFTPDFGLKIIHKNLDIYLPGMVAKYSDGGSSSAPLEHLRKDSKIIPSYSGIIITHPKIQGIDDMHDTYKLDRYDNLYKGHTTINLSGDRKIRLDHEK